MTLEQTRQLGIEFERRLQTINPQQVIVDKVDTQDIYAYLSMYQESYIKQLYTADQLVDSDTRPSNRIQDILRPLICRSTHSPVSTDDRSATFNLDANYWLYLRSSSIVTGTYKNYAKLTEIPNIALKQADVNDIIDTAFDNDRIIRNPIVTIAQYIEQPQVGDTFEVIYDRYTNVQQVKLVYIRKPLMFSILTNTPCELPMTCFEDLVNGAVELYFNDKYKLAIASSAANRKARTPLPDNDNQQ